MANNTREVIGRIRGWQQRVHHLAGRLEDLEWESTFLIDEMEGVKSLVYNDEIIGLEQPPTVSLKITECAPAVRGNSATARTKPATLETGHTVLVPEHTSPDEVLNVDTRTGESLGRAK